MAGAVREMVLRSLMGVVQSLALGNLNGWHYTVDALLPWGVLVQNMGEEGRPQITQITQISWRCSLDGASTINGYGAKPGLWKFKWLALFVRWCFDL